MAPRSNAKQSAALDPALPQKKRARRRVVGALAVCVAAAIVLPVVLDSEPRQIRDDVQVQIPSRDTPISEPLPGAARDADRSLRAPDAKPDAVADAAGKVEPSDGDRAAAQPESAGGTGGAVRDEARPDSRSEARPAAKSGAPAEAGPSPPIASAAPVAKADAKADVKADVKGDARPAEKAEAKVDPKLAAKGDAKAGAKAPTYLLQIGAFASEKGAADQAQRARKAGLKAYTEKVQTPNGERIRVRVGPFGSREAANDARGKLRAIGVDAALIGP